ncbi:bromoperoxidase [Mycobacterium intracellulare]|uniref:alpha/beta fold hydrolase n=1 Tax=Mycobacterium intracellulare TaxID=1767 RepID=UPI0007EAA7B2|nr:alpha/beta fold hydrolase [Mycobacterium intracellulare]OBH45090.1 bromoperoxidase [Mycobacterium intracellulare]
MPDVIAHHGVFEDTHLHVDDTGGTGRPVLLMHPWPLSGQAWSAQVPALRAAGYRVITYDRRGFGRSDKPLTGYSATRATAAFVRDQDAFYDQQMTEFFTANGQLRVSAATRAAALGLCRQAGKEASLACMAAWANTDFRGDLARVSVPTLIIHGDGDESVPLHGSARRTHEAIPGSELRVIADGPHGCQISHPEEFNAALLDFLAR